MLATLPARLRTLAFAMLLVLGPPDTPAQGTAQRLPRVGFCPAIWGKDHAFTKVFVESMRKLGWVDGKNFRIVYPRGTLRPGDTTLSCADYIAEKDVDLIVGDGFHADPNYKVPIVTTLQGVLGTPLAKSPTRNVTGLTNEAEDPLVRDKMIELLKEATGAEHIFLLFAGPAPSFKPGLGSIDDLPDGERERVREAARRLRIKVTPVAFTKHEDLEPAFRAISSTPKSAAIMHHSVYWYRLISEHRTMDWYIHKHRIVLMMPGPDWVRSHDTCMIGYGKGMLEEKERYSYFVDRILRGAKPADLPFEQLPYRLGINLDAAKLYGITIPDSVKLQADIVVPPHPRFEWLKAPPGPAGMEP